MPVSQTRSVQTGPPHLYLDLRMEGGPACEAGEPRPRVPPRSFWLPRRGKLPSNAASSACQLLLLLGMLEKA